MSESVGVVVEGPPILLLCRITWVENGNGVLEDDASRPEMDFFLQRGGSCEHVFSGLSRKISDISLTIIMKSLW